ncbi:hypothetical protein ACHAQH_004295 [Verticillium albo-atrum]
MDGSTSSRSPGDKDTDISEAPEDTSGTGPDGLSERHLSSGSAAGVGPPTKRSRILLSCATCRTSKLKCDRSSPCGQCIRKGRPEACQYAPKPQRSKPNQSMASRLKRLEGMVRTMLEEGDVAVDRSRVMGELRAAPPTVKAAEGGRAEGQVVHGERGSTYIGATHFMAMLEDIEDLKSYFDEETDVLDGQSPEEKSQIWDEYEVPGVLLFSHNGPGSPRNRNEVLSILPDRQIVDRLVMRYFASKSPSMYLVHRPTFLSQYREFWHATNTVDSHWLAQLFMVLCLATHFSTYMAPHELARDSPEPSFVKIKRYRSAAAWCLVRGKYHQPTEQTIGPFIMYAEAEFLLNRHSQMNCYLLASTAMRLMLKMGFHRDPSKLAHMSAFEGEMRRRTWHMGMTLDLLVSFHMGLPAMIHGIDSDVELPRNVLDQDFGPESTELPPSQPMTDYTDLTYPLCKNKLMICFGHVARLAHLLTPPPYSEVLRLDNNIQEAWKAVPDFMRVRPIEESVTDPATQIIQRFGLASIYNKGRCVLHRRFLVESVIQKEHDYSRVQCLDAAVMILEHQYHIWHMCQPGNILSQHGWFVSSIAVHDFLLSAMILFLVIEKEKYPQEDSGFGDAPVPSKAELVKLLQRAHGIWRFVARDLPAVKKTADIVETMLGKIGSPPGMSPDETGNLGTEPSPQGRFGTVKASVNSNSMSDLSINGMLPQSSSLTGCQLTWLRTRTANPQIDKCSDGQQFSSSGFCDS